MITSRHSIRSVLYESETVSLIAPPNSDLYTARETRREDRAGMEPTRTQILTDRGVTLTVNTSPASSCAAVVFESVFTCHVILTSGFPPTLKYLENENFFQSGKSPGILKKCQKSRDV